jgi:hypothetical protein
MKVDIHLLYPDFYGDIFMGGFLDDEHAIPRVYSRHDRPPEKGAIEVDGQEGTFDLDVRDTVIGGYVKRHHPLKEQRWIKPHKQFSALGGLGAFPHIGREPAAKAIFPAIGSGRGALDSRRPPKHGLSRTPALLRGLEAQPGR